ncbi:Uu.00g132520.m01.CDS01 [Anthostomella pinea]|uniref:Uu.00g132520.m01.CDS01 n=1 Tax=Anthostomella pinea TaxID=933095 RepID=A0AAI8VJ06_9PEZI|nr:Uu.00g132520.m01.CDS01 [Anthostomella pinea]
MQFLTLAPALVAVAFAAPQGATDKLAPRADAPAGCSGSFDGNFEITIAKVTEQKRSLVEKRDTCGKEGILVLSLKDGETTDAQGRTGYIASNNQFQFDAPVQAGALTTSGFSVCEDNLLALGDSKTFYQCLSGDFYNLYNRNWAPQCEPVSIVAVPCGGKDTASQVGDGQVVGTTLVQTTIVTALTDGQPQVVTTEVPIPICQIGDGQVQAVTTPCISVPASATSTYVPVSEYTDGQVQVTPPGTAPAPSATATETATAAPSSPETASPSSPETSAPAGTAPAGSAPAGSVPAASSSGAAAPSGSSSGAISSPSVTATSTTVASPSSSAPATTSAPAQGGSSRVTAGSLGALVVGLLVAVVCL